MYSYDADVRSPAEGPPSPRRSPSTSLGLAVLAVVLAGVAAATVTLADGESDFSDWPLGSVVPTSTQAADPGPGPWTVEGNEGDNTGVIRALAAGSDRLVVVTRKSVTAIDRRTGKKMWVATAPDAEGRIGLFCGASTTASASGRYLGVTLGMLKKDQTEGSLAECAIVAVVDLDTGKLTHSNVVAREGGTYNGVTGMPVEFIGDTLIVGWATNVVGLDLEATIKWRTVLSSRPDQKPNCEVRDLRLTGHGTFVVLSSCVENARTKDLLDEGDVTGTPGKNTVIGEAEVGAPFSSVKLLSASPVLLRATLDDRPPVYEQTTLVLLGDDWKVKSRISDDRTNSKSDNAFVTVGIGNPGLPAGPWTEQLRSAINGNELLAITPPRGNKPNSVVAVDLVTGKELWRTEQPALQFMQILAVTDTTVVAMETPVDDRQDFRQSVVTLDRATGALRGKATSEVRPRNGKHADPQTKNFGVGSIVYGYVYADGRAYGVDFQSAGLGTSDSHWLAYAIG